MTFRCRDLQMNVFEFSCETVEQAIIHIEKYESENKTAVRAFEKSTKCRIVGWKLEKTK